MPKDGRQYNAQNITTIKLKRIRISRRRLTIIAFVPWCWNKMECMLSWEDVANKRTNKQIRREIKSFSYCLISSFFPFAFHNNNFPWRRKFYFNSLFLFILSCPYSAWNFSFFSHFHLVSLSLWCVALSSVYSFILLKRMQLQKEENS